MILVISQDYHDNQSRSTTNMAADNPGSYEGEEEDMMNGLKIIEDSHQDSYTFDTIIGHLEDMLIDERFKILQDSFLENYWTEFEDTDENKHTYMVIFMQYTDALEAFIVQYLRERMPHFHMNLFITELESRKDELDGEIFELLFTLTDFQAFKQMFLDYKKMKEQSTPDLSSAITIRHIF